MTIQLFTVPVNQAQIQTWLSISVKLINTDIDYTNSLSGLFGNFNNIKGDDITSRSGTSIPSNSRTRDIYSTAITCNLVSFEFYSTLIKILFSFRESRSNDR